ncbi:MAG: hypothetical protein R2864_01010 [Syntrophotaleaceae bacterium]
MLSYDFLEQFFSNSNCLIAVIDRQQGVVYSNLRHGDDPRPDLEPPNLPRCFELFYPGQQSCCDSCHVQEVFASGEPLVRDKVHPRLGPLQIRCLPIRDEGAKLLWSSSRSALSIRSRKPNTTKSTCAT